MCILFLILLSGFHADRSNIMFYWSELQFLQLQYQELLRILVVQAFYPSSPSLISLLIYLLFWFSWRIGEGMSWTSWLLTCNELIFEAEVMWYQSNWVGNLLNPLFASFLTVGGSWNLEVCVTLASVPSTDLNLLWLQALKQVTICTPFFASVA